MQASREKEKKKRRGQGEGKQGGEEQLQKVERWEGEGVGWCSCKS